MTHENRKKVLAKLLAAVMILSLLPIQVLAATNASYDVLDSQVQIATSAENGGSSQDSATGAITATTAASGSCNYTAKTTTITITNKSGSEQMLYMNYSLTLSGGSCSIDGSSTTDASGRILKTLASGGSFAITITSNSDNTNTTSITLSDFAFVSDEEYAITFNAPGEGATMSIGGEAITDWDENGQYTVRAACQPGIEISAAIASGYTFYYWLQCEEGAEQSGRVLSSDTSFTLQPTSDMIIELVVIKASDADGLFLVGSEVFSDFTAALRAAESGTDKVVIPLRDCIIPEGEYYIPAGVTLLIPFNDENTVYTDTPGYNSTHTTPSAYRRVTLASNAEISVDGAISIGAMHTPAAGGKRMSVNGKYGQLILQEGSCITLNDGANLYAWGYVTGSGEVKAMSGATVYEYFQLADFRGGTVTSNMNGNDYDVFPMSSYYVQNIEARLVLYYGAKEMGYASVYALHMTVGASPTFIGEGGLFQLSAPDGVSENTDDSYIVKYYDPISDKLYVEVYGNASIKSISMTIATISVNSADYILPINNMIIKLIRGGLTTDQRIMLMPGSGLVIGEEAALSLADTASETSALYVVAREEWGSFTWNGVDNNYIAPVVYSPSWTNGCPRTWANTESAFLEVNGTVNVNGILATSASAVVTSTGRGAINYNCTASAGALYGYAQSSGEYVAIPTNSAVLQNADGTTVETADAAANDYYEYSDGFWLKNGEAPLTYYHISFVNYDGAILWEGDVAEGEIPVYEGATPEKPATAEYSYTFTGWTPDVVAVTGDATYTAVFSENANSYTITYNVNGVFCAEQTYDYGAAVTAPEYTVPEGHTFSGWNVPETMPAENLVLNATLTVNSYTITYNVNGEFYAEQTYEYGAAVTAPEYACEYTYYHFSGWAVPDTMPAHDASYDAVMTPYDGIEWYADELYLFDNGEMVEFPGLVRVVTDDDVKYYYFGEENFAARARMIDGEVVNEYMVEKNNGLLYAGDNYIFGEDGVIEHLDYTLNGIKEVDGKLYYLIDGVIIRHGLVEVDGSFYYCRSTSGELVRNTRYWITRTNGLTWADGTPIEAGYYFFDEEAKLSDKNGIIAENGSLYYYVHGSLTPAGLIELDGDYYYVRTSNCEVIHGRSYWITVTNGLMPIGLYEFDDTGKMLNPPTGQPGEEEPEIKNGIVAEFGSLYYYVDGVLTPAGLIELDGEYYYVRTSNCEVVHGCSYWITVTNGLMPAGMYTFADDGKLIH